MSSIFSDSEHAKLIEKWRQRHAVPDVVGVWAISVAPEAYAYAFNAVAQDPRVLQRAARTKAIRMAVQAEEFALSVAQSDVAKSATWLAAALFVQRAIDAWRQSLRAYDRHGGGVGASFAATNRRVRLPLGDPWENASRNFPHVDDETGRLATRILHDFGAAVLPRVRKPWDHVIVLGVLRYAARRLRGELPDCGSGIAGANTVADILLVQSYAEANLLSPMLVPYCGPGKPALQALSLLRDARTLHDAVCAAGAGGTERASIWRKAIDLHAFAAVALDHRMLLDLPLDEAYQLAAAAHRHAVAAIQTPDQVEMPVLPGGRAAAPEVVALHAKACLPGRGAAEPQPSGRADHGATTSADR